MINELLKTSELSPASNMDLIFVTRPSALARWQTQWVIQALKSLHPGLLCSEQVITTQGDRILDRSLPDIGGKGVFTQELEVEIMAGRAQAAVHSLKDLPVENPTGLTICCIPPRVEMRDALVSGQGYTLESLPEGASLGTSSPRRAAQALARRPDLKIQTLRGNVDTRLRKALSGAYDAIILAGAGLIRLGLQEHVAQWLPLDVMLPAPGQGALAVQCRENDETTLETLDPLDDQPTRLAVTAERAFLMGLGGGCAVPVAAYASIDAEDPGLIHLNGLVISPDGKRSVRLSADGRDPLALGARLSHMALEQGASDILLIGSPGGSK